MIVDINKSSQMSKVYEEVFHKRRSTRKGVRRSTRLTNGVSKMRSLDKRVCVYDRDMGGYKWGSDKWRRTKREVRQLLDEQALVSKMKRKAKRMTESGYAQDEFVVDDDEVDNESFTFETDDTLDKADAIASGTDTDESGGEWCPSEDED